MEMGFGFSQPNDQKIMFLLAWLLPLKFACVRHWAFSTIRIKTNLRRYGWLEEISSTERTNPHGFSLSFTNMHQRVSWQHAMHHGVSWMRERCSDYAKCIWPNVFKSNSSSNINSSSWLCVSFAVNIIIIGSMIRNGNQHSNENIVIWIEIHPDVHQQRHTGAL